MQTSPNTSQFSVKRYLVSLHNYINAVFSLLPPDTKETAISLATATHKKTRTTSHIHFLRNCLRTKTIPSGFRSQFLPSISYISPSDLHIFSTLDTKLALHRMRATLHCHQKQITTLNHSISSLSKHLRVSTTTNPSLYLLIRHIIHHSNSTLYQLLSHHKSKKFDFSSQSSSPAWPSYPSPAPPSIPSQSPSCDPTPPIIPPTEDTTNHLVVCLPPTLSLSPSERSLLTKGLAFVPLARTADPYQIRSFLQDFFRRLRLRFHFQDNSEPPPITDFFYSFRPPSSWTPPSGQSAALDLFIKKTTADFENINFEPVTYSNLPLSERQAIKTLRQRTDIVIKPADKGGAVVVWDKDLYLREANNQLFNTTNNFYATRSTDSTLSNNNIVGKTIHELIAADELPSKARLLHLPNSKLGKPCFYLLPKIHKTHTPGRPIVSACSCPTEIISDFLDFQFQPIVLKLKTYVKDTNHALCIFDNISFSDNSPKRLFLMDVVSLYTSIPHHLGLKALKFFLEQRPSPTVSTSTLLRLAELVLTLNSFEFNGQYFDQISGVAMGTKMGPSYACLFMGHLEHRISLAYPGPHPEIYLRYIDDGFGVTSMTQQELDGFFVFVTEFSKPIKYTFTQSDSSVNFLDISVALNDTGLSTSIFYKPTDSHSYLHYSSSHPSRCKDSIPFSQFLRLRRICSDDQDFLEEAERMSSFFLHRGYPSHVVHNALLRVRSLPRQVSLTTRRRSQSHRIPLVLPFHPHSVQVRDLVRANFPILLSEEETAQVFAAPPLFAFRRHQNLKDLLVRSRFSSPSSIGTRPCSRRTCKTCPFVSSCTFLKFPTKTWHIKDQFTCMSRNIIYAISCKRCGLSYIGESGLQLSDRFGHHRRDVESEELKPVPQHFNQPGHRGTHDMSVAILRSCTGSSNSRKAIENRLIFTLGTLHPMGINVSHNFLS